ncbi:MAG: hypothetical protein QM703_21420 [Gemmatales bacterium]
MHPVVFLLDVDNTLLDNDRFGSDLRAYLTEAFGSERQERYWAIFEKLRTELGYADYLGRCNSIGSRILTIPTSCKSPTSCWSIHSPNCSIPMRWKSSSTCTPSARQ